MINRAVHGLNPCISKKPSLIGNPDNQSFNSSLSRFSYGHIRQPKVRLAAFKADLTKTPFTAPMRDAVGRFRSQLVWHITNEHQVWIFNLDHRFFPKVALRFVPFFFNSLKAS
jgi:hypothetical protein